MVVRDGEPVMACGTPGGDQQDQWQLCFLLAHFAGGLDLQAAIDAPAWHITSFPSSFAPRLAVPGEVVVEDRVGPAVVAELERRGHRVTMLDSWSLGPAVRGDAGPGERPPVRRGQPARDAGVRGRAVTAGRCLATERIRTDTGNRAGRAELGAGARRVVASPPALDHAAGRRAGRHRRGVPGRARGRRHRDGPAAGRRPRTRRAGPGAGPGADRTAATGRALPPGRGARGRAGQGAGARRRPRSVEFDAGTGRLAALPIRKGLGELAELEHAGGTTIVLLHNFSRLRARAIALGPDGRAVALGEVLDALPMRDGTVLAEDCSGASGTGPCTLTGYAPTGAVRWKRPAPSQLDLVRDTPYGLLVLAPGHRGRGWCGWRTRAPAPSTG
jgi:hypothetical protein